MRLQRTKALALATAIAGLAAVAMLGPAAPTAAAQTASASGCDGVSVTPSSRTVRRGGRVLLSGQACGASYAAGSRRENVRIKLRKGKRWKNVARAATDSSGEFEACVPVRVPSRTRIARLQASSSAGTRTVSVRVSPKKGSRKCGSSGGGGGGANTPSGSTPRGVPSGSSSSSPGGSSGGSGSYVPPSSPPGNPDCPLSQPGSTIGMTLPTSCTVVTSDTSSNPDPLPFWGKLDCANSSRHQQIGSGGDGHQTATGSSQANTSFRRLSVVDGDDAWGERCEMGYNWNKATDGGWGIMGPGPTVLYHEGQRRVTFMSIRLPGALDIDNGNWRTVMQMKQTQPYTDPTPAPMIELNARSGKWLLISDWNETWTTSAQTGTWTRFAFDITYSRDPDIGSIKVYVDKNGDGDAGDAGEQSPTFHLATLRAESGSGAGVIPLGGSIPSHLRAGIYQNPNYSCPGPTGCSVELDNVQVVRA
jgi:hypothetical protein